MTTAAPWLRPHARAALRVSRVSAVLMALALGSWATLAASAAAEGHLLYCGHPGFAQLSLRLDALVAMGVPWGELRVSSLMIAAMMLPVVLPMARFVHARSAWRRRGRSTTLFVVGYCALWTAICFASVPVVLVAGSLVEMTGARPLAVAAAFCAAALFQVSPAKERALNRCHGTVPLRAFGAAADVDAARFGAVHGWRCVRSCAPAMGALAIAGHSLPAMGIVTVALVRERRVFRPSGRETAWLMLLAGGVSLLAGR